jgi:hypothetical protein
MSTEDVRKAEELANWDFIKARSSIEELRDHLARFPGGVTERYAQAGLAELMWSDLSATSPVEALRAFVEAFPRSEHTAVARSWLAEAERRAADEQAAVGRSREAAGGRPTVSATPMAPTFGEAQKSHFWDNYAQRGRATLAVPRGALGRIGQYAFGILVYYLRPGYTRH